MGTRRYGSSTLTSSGTEPLRSVFAGGDRMPEPEEKPKEHTGPCGEPLRAMSGYDPDRPVATFDSQGRRDS
jgi:hypothetical protein